jgi:hypothetical protein
VPHPTSFNRFCKLSAKVLEFSIAASETFLVNGFAWDGSTSLVTVQVLKTRLGAEFCLTLVAPATVSSGKACSTKRSCKMTFL